MTPDQAVDLAARTLAAIDNAERVHETITLRSWAADRERVASDLAGLRYCVEWWGEPKPCNCDDGPDGHLHHPDLFAFFAEGLRRTARLYGVE